MCLRPEATSERMVSRRLPGAQIRWVSREHRGMDCFGASRSVLDGGLNWTIERAHRLKSRFRPRLGEA